MTLVEEQAARIAALEAEVIACAQLATQLRRIAISLTRDDLVKSLDAMVERTAELLRGRGGEAT
jgi:hypothetical protein